MQKGETAEEDAWQRIFWAQAEQACDCHHGLMERYRHIDHFR